MGQVLGGRYELVDPLGEGGAGVVWRAWDRRAGRYVAAKVMRQADAASLLRFVREQAVRIEHHHVLTPLGWAGEDELVLFTMPIVRGGSAATLVGDHGPLPAVWVAVLLDQLLDALATIHDAGLVHRDVKPANLLLDATGRERPRARLADFGIATALDQPRLTHASQVVGTVGYAAPETFSAGWDPDPRADLFAAGMTAAELLLGQRPDAVEDLAQALVRAEVPVRLSSLVLDLVDPDPRQRPADAQAARTALRATGLVGEGATWEPGDVEIFDQLPELPDRWGDDGPLPAQEDHPAAQADGQGHGGAPAGLGGATSARTGAIDVPRTRTDLDSRAEDGAGHETPPGDKSGDAAWHAARDAAGDAAGGAAGDATSPAPPWRAWAGPVLLVLGLVLILVAILIAVL